MCACAPGFVCARCQGTPFDDRYLEDAHEPMTADHFDRLTDERPTTPERWT